MDHQCIVYVGWGLYSIELYWLTMEHGKQTFSCCRLLYKHSKIILVTNSVCRQSNYNSPLQQLASYGAYGHDRSSISSSSPLDRYHPSKSSPYNNNPGSHGYPEAAATFEFICVFSPLYDAGYGNRPYNVLDRYHDRYGSPFNANPGDRRFPGQGVRIVLPFAPSGLRYISLENSDHNTGYGRQRAHGYGNQHQKRRSNYSPYRLFCTVPVVTPFI